MSRIGFLVCSIIIALPIAVERLYAHPFDEYEFDSLAYLSSDVTEVEIMRDFQKYNLDLTDVRVMRVFKGNLAKGRVITVDGPHYYRKSKKNLINTESLAVGDRLVVFLTRLKPDEERRFPKSIAIYAPLPGGMRFVRNDRVCRFMSGESSAPSVADTEAGPDRSISLEEFDKQLLASIQKTQAWGRLVEAKLDEQNASRMLELLRVRAKRDDRNDDYFGKRICLRFAESHNIEWLGRAMAMTEYQSILSFGFGTPQGRDYLIARVKDEHEPMASRLCYAKAIDGAGEVFQSKDVNIREHGCNIEGEASDGNSGYLTRIAEAARAVANHEELCLELIRDVKYAGSGIVQNKPAPLMVDLRGALSGLKKLYDARPSQEIQCEIEEAAECLPDEYEKLKSPCGPVISILNDVDETKFTKPEKPSVIFSYSIVPFESGRNLNASVVLLNEQSKERFTKPFDYNVPEGGGVGGTNSVLLPNKLPHGRYRIFLEFSDGNVVRSKGHYFVRDL